ncbi:hypothetical protein EV195_10590 [Tenacibaculum skagerrakense]|uniref:Lipoprotein n=1 Tax=Tenacibaculum skagerrakense TaxID=186571 RepID=A0A4R2NRU2_9FLAO|nr:hypothetical protein [Tenacibaculum skagerrakense]TCP24659.1 hypothetical protein EV195_10590 [Tenacibaculum skagerrakense]
MKNKISILIFSIVFMSCSNTSFDSKEKLWEYLRDVDNGYLHQKNVNGYDFSLLYKPTDLLVTQELNSSYTEEDVKKLRTKYKNYIYFTLSMAKNNKELLSTTPKNRQEFGAMVNNLAFGMGEKVHVYTAKKDTLELLDYVYPRMYGMSRSTDMLFVYPRDKKYLQDEYINITIGDLGTYTGEVKFKIPTQKIKNEPKINF